MLSVSCKASIKAVIYLGSELTSEQRVGTKTVAQFINENEHTVGKILQRLVKNGIIESVKGPHGGFYISDKQKKLPVIAIVNAIDGKDVFNKCGLGLAKCNSSHPCPLHTDFTAVRDQFAKMCNKNTIKDLCSQVNQGLAFLIGK
jgi:Rrf2 family protein